jgi:hypothetical protein
MRLCRKAPKPGYPLAINVLPMSFRGEGSAGESWRDPFSLCRQKGFFVWSSRPGTGAWYARRRFIHHLQTLIELLVCGAAGLCSQALVAQTGEPPVYETVVMAAPTVVEAPYEDPYSRREWGSHA